MEQQLIDLLGNIAMYNDKGWQWTGHSPAQIASTRDGFQRSLLALQANIPTARLGAELVAAIENGTAANDDSGRYRALALARFASNEC
ncbi:hypothetical protein [Andreprevotia lacus]|jgi:hypothetical protein|nr:hypothetical protein [Andreprevotia lacus]